MFADFCGINTSITANFKLPTRWGTWAGEETGLTGSRGPAQAGSRTPLHLCHLPTNKGALLEACSYYLGSNHVLCIFLFACCRVEHDIVNGLYQFQLDHTLDEEAGKQFLIYIR